MPFKTGQEWIELEKKNGIIKEFIKEKQYKLIPFIVQNFR